jgi:class 3 adenylate cyclase
MEASLDASMEAARDASTSALARDIGTLYDWGVQLATATRSVVFTDLSGYTAWVVQGDRESLRDLLARHEAAVAPRIRSHNGRIVKTIGDSFMALFESATDAVRAALEIVEEGGLALRVSIATGDVEEIGSDVYGEAVNLSSRINHEMPPSEVWFSESTLLCLKQAEIPWQQMGCFEFKGITGETPLYRAIPSHKVWLPPAIVTAARQNTLALIGADGAIPPLPPDATLLIHSRAVSRSPRSWRACRWSSPRASGSWPTPSLRATGTSGSASRATAWSSADPRPSSKPSATPSG